MTIVVALPSPALAQRDAPPPPELRTWSMEGREPSWRARVEAEDGFGIDSLSLLRRRADGVIVSSVESWRGDTARPVPPAVFVERRDGATALWRQRVPGLPYSRALYMLAPEGQPDTHLTAVAIFKPASESRGAAHGSIIAIDERTGALRVTGIFPYPGGVKSTPDDWIELARATMLRSGLIAIHGGIGSGPFSWWIGLRRADGAVVWDVIGRRTSGHVVDVRPLKDGFDVSLVNIMSLDQDRSIGPYLLRVDNAGRVTSSKRFRGGPTAPVLLRDGGLAYLARHDPAALVVEDRLGRRRFAVTVPGGFNIVRCLDDGACVIGRSDGIALVSPDGKSVTIIAGSKLDTEFLPDGSFLVSRCEARDCAVRNLALFARPQ